MLKTNVSHYLEGLAASCKGTAKKGVTTMASSELASMEPVVFKGVPGSPYTRKMLAYLRFRHIGYQLLIGDQASHMGLPEAKVQLLPTLSAQRTR